MAELPQFRRDAWRERLVEQQERGHDEPLLDSPGVFRPPGGLRILRRLA
jgi:hypothetical protein